MLGHEVVHLLIHGNGLLQHLSVVDGVPLAVGVIEDRVELVLVEAVYDILEVLLVALPAFVDLGRHVPQNPKTPEN